MSDKMIICIVTVDDHPLMAGIAGEINSQADMRVVAQASGGEEAIILSVDIGRISRIWISESLKSRALT